MPPEEYVERQERPSLSNSQQSVEGPNQQREVLIVALHVLCQNHEQIDPSRYQSSIMQTWQDEVAHPMLRWEISLKVEEILSSSIPFQLRNLNEQNIVHVSRIIENYMYFSAPSFQSYVDEGSLEFVTKMFVLQLASHVHRGEGPNYFQLQRVYDRVIR